MKTRKFLLLTAIILVFCFTLTACHGIIPPVIGESGMANAANGEQNAPGEDAAMPAEGGDAPAGEQSSQGGDGAADGQSSQGGEGGEGEQSSAGSGGGESEPVVAPEMAGNVVYRFYHEEMKTTSMGGLEQFTAEAQLFDEANADGFNGFIHLQSGSSENYMTFTWTENEDGSMALQMDEFNLFEAKEVEGVLTIVGIRYSLGMMNSGVVDIPLVK